MSRSRSCVEFASRPVRSVLRSPSRELACACQALTASPTRSRRCAMDWVLSTRAGGSVGSRASVLLRGLLSWSAHFRRGIARLHRSPVPSYEGTEQRDEEPHAFVRLSLSHLDDPRCAMPSCAGSFLPLRRKAPLSPITSPDQTSARAPGLRGRSRNLATLALVPCGSGVNQREYPREAPAPAGQERAECRRDIRGRRSCPRTSHRPSCAVRG